MNCQWGRRNRGDVSETTVARSLEEVEALAIWPEQTTRCTCRNCGSCRTCVATWLILDRHSPLYLPIGFCYGLAYLTREILSTPFHFSVHTFYDRTTMENFVTVVKPSARTYNQSDKRNKTEERSVRRWKPYDTRSPEKRAPTDWKEKKRVERQVPP